MKFISAVVLSSLFILVACEKANLFTDEIIDIQEETAHLYTYSSDVIPGSYVVVFKNDFIDQEMSSRSVADTYEGRVAAVRDVTEKVLEENQVEKERITYAYGTAIKGFAANLNDDQVESLRRDNRIKYIEQDQIITVSMGGPPGGGGGGDPTQSTPWGITRVGGSADGTNAGTAWIIDSGIDMDHPDLNVDAGRSVSFLSGGGGNTEPEDKNGHGTHVAGTVAAIDNGIGVVGVAAGATVVAVRVLDRRGSGSTSGVIAGVDYVGANASNGDAANMSLGGGYYGALNDAVIAASSACPFVLAAGNESTNAETRSPASANGNNIYTISAMDSNDNWASFSNYGSPVDYCAPGVSVLSTYKDGGYATSNGTSMAAPHVCGIVLLGNVSSDGTVNGDPDGDPDPIAHR
ncbi:MAG: S8 family peptidase [Bacteroidetes bacterium]|nr:MAG: S8 family peptidase [Bacteroidota bacterium]